ncbi:MAG: DUF1573 domain-containing protein [Phycisphaerales bacterium]
MGLSQGLARGGRIARWLGAALGAVAVVLGTGGTALGVPPDVPLSFEPASIDFGYIEPGSEHTATVTVTNTSQIPVTQIRPSTSCACTQVGFDRQTLGPGESAEMTITLTGSYAMIDKTVLVRLSADSSRFGNPAELPVRSFPNLGLVAKPSLLAGTPEGRSAITGFVTISSVDGTPFTLKSVDFQEVSSPPEASAEQGVECFMPLDRKKHWFVIETTHPTCPIIALPVGDGPLRREALQFARAESINLSDRREITLGYIEPGQTVRVKVPMLRPEARLQRPVTARSVFPGLKAEVVDWENLRVSPGRSRSTVYEVDAVVEITATGEPGGVFLSEIKFAAQGDPSELTIHVIGRIVEPGMGTVTPAGGAPPGLLRP